MPRKTKAVTAQPVRMYKGFNKDMCCTSNSGVPFLYEVGKTYSHSGKFTLCSQGFHACESPLDVLFYYPPIDGNRYAIVEMSGISAKKENDTKRVAKTIKIVHEISSTELIDLGIDYISNLAATRHSSNLAATGAYSKLAATGDSSNLAASGDHSQLAVGVNGIASVAALYGRVKGDSGSAMSLGYKDSACRLRIAVAYVGENGIESDTWYKCDNFGNFIKEAQ